MWIADPNDPGVQDDLFESIDMATGATLPARLARAAPRYPPPVMEKFRARCERSLGKVEHYVARIAQFFEKKQQADHDGHWSGVRVAVFASGSLARLEAWETRDALGDVPRK